MSTPSHSAPLAKPTRDELALLLRLVPALADMLRPVLSDLARQVAEVKGEVASLRLERSATPVAAERRFVEIVPADEAGFARLLMDDGSHVKVRDTRDRMWGRA